MIWRIQKIYFYEQTQNGTLQGSKSQILEFFMNRYTWYQIKKTPASWPELCVLI